MPNMSYCQFQNTLLDLQQCFDALIDDKINSLSPEERRACDRLRELCQDFTAEYDEQYYDEEENIDDYDEQNDVDVIDEPAAVIIDEFKPYIYQVGDKVRIIGNSNGHGHSIDDVLTITEQHYQRPAYNVYEVNDEYLVREYDMELAE